MTDPSVSPNSTWDYDRAYSFLEELDFDSFRAFESASWDLKHKMASKAAESIVVPKNIVRIARNNKIQGIKALRELYFDKKTGNGISLLVAKVCIENIL